MAPRACSPFTHRDSLAILLFLLLQLHLQLLPVLLQLSHPLLQLQEDSHVHGRLLQASFLRGSQETGREGFSDTGALGNTRHPHVSCLSSISLPDITNPDFRDKANAIHVAFSYWITSASQSPVLFPCETLKMTDHTLWEQMDKDAATLFGS